MKNKNIEKDFLIENLKIALHDNGNCHHNSKLLYIALKKLEYNIKLITGYFIRNDNINIKHSWIEFEKKILETDCEQLHIKSELKWKIIDDNNIKKRYKKCPSIKNKKFA